MSLDKHAGKVASPVTANPSEALTQILRTILECSLHLGLLVVLHGNFPVMRVHPTGDEVIIIGVELTSAPFFVCEAVSESLVLQDRAAIGNGASRKTRESTIDVQASRAVEVSSLKVSSTKEVPDAHAGRPPQAL